MKTISLYLLASLLFSTALFAQNEVMRERDSLQGLLEFGVVVNIEQPDTASIYALDLEASAIREQMLDRINELPVTILDNETLRQSDQLPILHMHINVMYVEPGFFPYTVNLKFYQPVKLVLQGDLGSTASTWESSFVGAVTKDYKDFIGQSALNLADGFKEDFMIANQKYEY